MGLHISNIYLTMMMLVVMSYVINRFSNLLGNALHKLEAKLHIPKSVRGATFDAISSSLPELVTALIAILVYKKFDDIGIPTVAGSGIFNILLIPMFVLLFYKGKQKIMQIDHKVLKRDIFFYIGALIIFFSFVAYGQLNVWTGVVLLAWYIFYALVLYKQTQNFQNNHDETKTEIKDSYLKLALISLSSLLVIWFAIDSIIFSAITISHTLHIPEYIIALIILAACTSIPDTLLSIKSARKGDMEGSLANAIGSNIFDVTVCLGLPLIIYFKPIEINLGENLYLFVFLILSMLVTALVLLQKKGFQKRDAFFMGLAYLVFLGYVVYKIIC